MYQVEVKLTCVRSSQNNNDTSLVCDSIGYLFEIGKNDCEALKKSTERDTSSLRETQMLLPLLLGMLLPPEIKVCRVL